jgi:hypothetical protein
MPKGKVLLIGDESSEVPDSHTLCEQVYNGEQLGIGEFLESLIHSDLEFV